MTATAGCSADLAGLVGVSGSDPRLLGITLRVELSSTSSADRVDALQHAWRERCPIYLAITEATDVALTFD